MPDQHDLPEGVEPYAFYRDVENGDGEWRELLDANAAAVPGREVMELIDRSDLPAIRAAAVEEERERLRDEPARLAAFEKLTEGNFFRFTDPEICVALLFGCFWPLFAAYWLIDKLVVPLVFFRPGGER